MSGRLDYRCYPASGIRHQAQATCSPDATTHNAMMIYGWQCLFDDTGRITRGAYSIGHTGHIHKGIIMREYRIPLYLYTDVTLTMV